MRKRYCDWMANEVKEYTRTGKIKRPSYETVVTWVKASWENVDYSPNQKVIQVLRYFCQTENELNTSLNQTAIDARS